MVSPNIFGLAAPLTSHRYEDISRRIRRNLLMPHFNLPSAQNTRKTLATRALQKLLF